MAFPPQSDDSQGDSNLTRREVLQAGGKLMGAGVAAAFVGAPSHANPEGDSITDMTAVELRAAIASRKVSCREVMSAYLAKIEKVNPDYNAIVSRKDPDKLLAEADAADALLARGGPIGPLHGFPQAIKDTAATTDMPTTLGSPLMADYRPPADAIIVERARKAGAILIGKTNVPEFGLGSHSFNKLFGTTVNAWDRTLAAGGSSGGAAVAVAHRMLPVADGSDLMGSLRNPAGWNNVATLRPSFGRVPLGPGGDVFYQQLAAEGPIGRTVADTALLLSVQAGRDARAPLSLDADPAIFAASLDRDFKGVRIGFMGNLNGYLAMEDGVLDVCTAALKHFESIGGKVEAVVPDFDMKKLWNAWLALRSVLIGGGYQALLTAPDARQSVRPELIWEVEKFKALTVDQLLQANTVRSEWYETLRLLFQRFDFLVSPTAQVFPFDARLRWPEQIAGKKMDTYHRWMEVVIPGSLAGGPVAAVPAGFDGRRRAMGLQILGPSNADLAVLQIAHAYEQASGFSRLKPN